MLLDSRLDNDDDHKKHMDLIVTPPLTYSFPFSGGSRIDINLSQNNLKDNRDKKLPGVDLESAKSNAMMARNVDKDMSDAGKL